MPYQASKNSKYLLVSIVTLTALALMAVVWVFLCRPDADNSQMITTILGFVTPTVLTLLAFMAHDTHMVVNSRIDEFKDQLKQASALATVAAHNAGIVEGQQQERTR